MPSVGGFDDSRSKDCDLEDVTSLIPVEIGGPNSSKSSILKSLENNTASQDKHVTSESATIMAPNKNGQMDAECKTSTPTSKEEIHEDKKPGDHLAGTQNGADENGSKDVKSEKQVERISEEKNECGEVPREGQMEKTAEVKRKEYKEKPRASSVEILGLKKMKNARIPNQGFLDQKICQSAESELRRRKSSPAAYNYMKHQRIPEEQSEAKTVDSLAINMTQLTLSGEKKDGFGKRLEEEHERNNLVSKGPIRPDLPQVRQQPYPVSHPGMSYAQPCQPPQQAFAGSVTNSDYQYQSSQTYIRSPGKKFMVPGMPSSQQIQLSDGRTMQNLSTRPQATRPQATRPQVTRPQVTRTQVPVPRKDPVESCWPPSPTDSCDPNSPSSMSSVSPSHTMQQVPSPAYSAYSPAQPQLSPQSMMSPADSYQGMSTSPNSPHSPEMMVMINSPPSVQSEDSGIASPPHHPVNYISVSGTNSGMVIDNSQRPYLDSNQIPVVDNIQYILQNRPQQNHQKFQQRSQEEVAEQSINMIKEQLKESTYEFEKQNSHSHPDNGQYLQQQYVNQHQVSQPMVRQQPTYQVKPMCPEPSQMQVVTPPPTPQDQNRNLKSLVNNMPLDVLCSLDEEGDSALHIAISQGNEQLVCFIIERLLRSGRKDALNLQDNLGQTPLHICMVTNQPGLIIYLLKAGADLMIRNKEQVTVLHYAAAKGFSNALLAIFHCLCEKSVAHIEIDVEDKNGMSPLQCAIQAHGRLARVYDGTQCMYVDKMVDSLDTIKNLLYLGADPSFQDRKSGYTALHFAVELPPCNRVTHNTHIIKIILEWHGVDARQLLKMPNYAGNTPLHVIAGREFDEEYVVKVIDHLISFGADIDLKNLEKQSPRDLAIVKKKERPKVFARLQGDHLQGK